MKLIADLHIHTVASDHAFSTSREIFEEAAAVGLRAAALTDHGPSLPDAPHLWHFQTMRMLPDVWFGVRLLRGAEVNIMDFDGRLDLPEKEMSALDFVIASMHVPCLSPGTRAEHTRAWLRVAENPLVDCIGHSGQMNYPYDCRDVVRLCRDTGTLMEINNNSFSARPGCEDNCRAIALCCAELGVPIVVNSDAHWAGQVGRMDDALSLLEAIQFPEELILNADMDRMADWFLKRKQIML